MAGTELPPVRVLIVEDSEDDALLILRQLRRGGFEPQMRRVDSAASMRAALDTQTWQLIIADHNMPGFDSGEALNLAREYDPDTPFIVVSGSIGEEVAVDVMKSGAHDYVMKNNLARLLPAIERELREAENRRARRMAEAKIHHMAYHDSLTGLVNRAEFERRLRLVLDSAHEEGEAHALIYLDLDQFKLVNDSCGHLAGDQLLRRLARKLAEGVRESDTLARLGGDEFGILLKGCTLERAERIAQELLNTIQKYQFTWTGTNFRMGASIGLVRADATQTPQTLLSIADMACYAAKDRGRNRIHIYTEGDQDLSRRRGEMQWIHRLQEAMSNEGLMLYHQPIRALQGGTSHSELLLRMKGDDGEIITPDRFIPAAERYNLMPEVDRWVIGRTLESLQVSHARHHPSGTTGAFFINLSGNSVSDRGLADYIGEQLQHHGIPAGRIGFEITETAAISDFDCALRLIRDLRSRGCRIALDDFGTGMSSFAYLKSLSVDFVKIDGGFVRNMLKDSMDRAIVEAINNIGHIAGSQTIAEYVENTAICECLKKIGVDYAQGWAIERPSELES